MAMLWLGFKKVILLTNNHKKVVFGIKSLLVEWKYPKESLKKKNYKKINHIKNFKYLSSIFTLMTQINVIQYIGIQ